MSDTRYFEAIAQNLAEEMGGPALTLVPIVDQLRRIAHDVALRLSPWMRHHPSCARVNDVDACDCGLTAALERYGR